MKTNKSPGPDGISIEFYLRHWQTIKKDFTEMINELHTAREIPEKMKYGIIKLIYKKGTKTDIRNYRPITLLNVDFKIYTKCIIKRITPALRGVLSKHQFAAPGKKIQQAATLARDLYEHANKKKLDAFLIALDFQKAFDSINQNFLREALSKLGLPKHFIHIVKSINTNTKSQVLVNGHLTRPIRIERGVRQADPLSMLLFLIAVEPLAVAIQNNNKINGIQLAGTQNIKACRYADDCTLTLTHATSVNEAFNEIQLFERACGLRLNKNKSQGLHCRPSIKATAELPDIPWTNQSISILGAVIGTTTKIEQAWRLKVRNLKEEMNKYGSYPVTYHAKAIFLKAKVMSQLTYIAQIYPLPAPMRKEITNSIENFITGSPKLKIPIDVLALPLNKGGHNIPHIALHCDLLFLKNIAESCRYRKEEHTLPDEMTLLEYNIGLQISNLLKIPARNNLSHASHPSQYYSCALAYCRKYKLTLETMINFKILTLYKHQITTNQITNAPTTGM